MMNALQIQAKNVVQQKQKQNQQQSTPSSSSSSSSSSFLSIQNITPPTSLPLHAPIPHPSSAPLTVAGPRRLLLYCNSNNRDKASDPLTEDFTMSIYPGTLPISKYDKLEIIHAAVPLVHNNIGPHSDTIYISENTDYSLLNSTFRTSGDYPNIFDEQGDVLSGVIGVPTMFELRIPHQNYSAFQLVNVLNNIIQTATPVISTNIPNYAINVGYAANAIDLRSRLSLQNKYTFYFDSSSNKILLQAIHPQTPNTDPVPFQIHCPSSIYPIDSTDMAYTNNPDSTIYQIKITSVQYHSETRQVTITAARSATNLVSNSIANIVLRSIAMKRVLVLDKYQLYTFPEEIPAPSSIANTTTFTLTLPESINSSFFYTDPDTMLIHDESIEGVLETYASQRMAWPLLGFTISNENGYTSYPITGFYNANVSDLSTVHLLTTNIPMKIPAGNTRLMLSNIVGNGTHGPYTVSSFVAPSAYNLAINRNSADFSSIQTIPSSSSSLHVKGYLTGNQIVDLRGSTVVFIRVDINGVPIGTIHPSFEFVPGRNAVYLGNILLDSVDGGTVFSSNRNSFIGSYVAPHSAHDAPSRIRVRLYDDKGKPYHLNGLDWSMTLEFYGS